MQIYIEFTENVNLFRFEQTVCLQYCLVHKWWWTTICPNKWNWKASTQEFPMDETTSTSNQHNLASHQLVSYRQSS